MMEFFIYLIKVNVAIIVLYGFYGLFFRNDTFFQWKRIFLLSVPLIALLYPLIDISSFLNNKIDNNIIFSSYYLNEVIITFNPKQSGGSFSFTDYLPALFAGIYWLGVIVLLVFMLLQIVGIFFLLFRTRKTQIYGQTIYRKKDLKTPFSFFRYIVLGSQHYPEHELQEIIRHEETHVRQCHSLDMLIAEIMTAFCWFNPFVWLMKREIRMNLEYLADRSVIDSGLGKEHYQFHLLRLTYHKAAAKITNNFNVSPLKKRIFMMNKKETSRLGLAKYLFVLPVIAALFIFNNCDTNAKKAAVSNKETDVVAIETPSEIQEVQETTQLSETQKVQETTQPSETTQSIAAETIYHSVEQMPQFPGGETALLKWLSDSIVYPQSASEKGIQGVTNIRFVIRSDGSIGDIQIVKSLDHDCDKEAIRVIKAMPKWIPGKQKGKPVNVYFNIPIQYKLSK